MTKHHPDINLLTEYVNGSSSIAESIAIKTHLHFCPACETKIHHLTQLAASLFASLEPVPLTALSFEQLFDLATSEHLDARKGSCPRKPCLPETHEESLPPTLHELLHASPGKWQKLTRSLQTMIFRNVDPEHEIALHKIKAGCKVPKHDHRGMEITVLLKGSFSDEHGIYSPGDFVVSQPGHVHQPVSAVNEDCFCLSVQEAPIKLTGIFAPLLNPFVRLQRPA